MEWPESVERVAQALRALAVDARLEELAAGTASAADAARAIGCDVEQIVKSLVFVCGGESVLALVPGDKRADPAKVAAAAGAEAARVATAEEVQAATGYPAGGVAPFAHPAPLRVLLDGDLLAHEVVWIGAGSPCHVAGLSPRDLVRIARAEPRELTL